MAINLEKGQNTQLDNSLKNLRIGLGWKTNSTDGADFDLDASVFMVKKDGKVISDDYFIFYNQTKSPDGSVEHTGDNLVGGDGDNDDETIFVHLDKVNSDVQSLFITVTIYEFENRKQNFGQVEKAYIRVLNADNNEEILRFDLSEDYSIETALIFGEIYRHNGIWKFRAVGQGFANGLYALCKQYGVNV